MPVRIFSNYPHPLRVLTRILKDWITKFFVILRKKTKKTYWQRTISINGQFSGVLYIRVRSISLSGCTYLTILTYYVSVCRVTAWTFPGYVLFSPNQNTNIYGLWPLSPNQNMDSWRSVFTLCNSNYWFNPESMFTPVNTSKVLYWLFVQILTC